MAKMPAQKPGKSEQNVQTPKVLLDAVRKRLDIEEFNLDIAADEKNAIAEQYFTEKMDAFKQPCWNYGGWSWLNPPYSKIEPWIGRAFLEVVDTNAKIAVLVPASVGSNWWASGVHGLAHVLFLNGRVTFVGHTKPYPKDLALLLYQPYCFGGYETWDWRKQ